MAFSEISENLTHLRFKPGDIVECRFTKYMVCSASFHKDGYWDYLVTLIDSPTFVQEYNELEGAFLVCRPIENRRVTKDPVPESKQLNLF